MGLGTPAVGHAWVGRRGWAPGTVRGGVTYGCFVLRPGSVCSRAWYKGIHVGVGSPRMIRLGDSPLPSPGSHVGDRGARDGAVESWKDRTGRVLLGCGLASGAAILLGTVIPPAGSGALPPPESPGADASCRADAHLLPADQASGLGVRWSEPPHVSSLEERKEMEAWCRGVGPPLLHRPGPVPHPAADGKGLDGKGLSPSRPDAVAGLRTSAGVQEPGPDGDRVVVMAWNTHVGNGDLDGLLRDLRSGHLTGAPEEHFILLLQEVYRAGPTVPGAATSPTRSADRIGGNRGPGGDRSAGSIDRVARRHDLHLFYAPSMRNGRPGTEGTAGPEDRGNAILSTLPLHDPEVLELPLRNQRRTVASATVGWTGSDGARQRFRVASVHLDHRSAWGRLHRSLGADRAEQVDRVVDALRAHPHAVVGGDFNSWFGGQQEEGIQRMREAFPLPEAAPAASTLVPWIPLLNPLVDHLFFRLPEGWLAQYRVVDDPYGSDHRPLLGWIGTSGGDAPAPPFPAGDPPAAEGSGGGETS